MSSVTPDIQFILWIRAREKSNIYWVWVKITSRIKAMEEGSLWGYFMWDDLEQILLYNNQMLPTPCSFLAGIIGNCSCCSSAISAEKRSLNVEMGADYGWQVNKIFFLHMTEEQFQIQSVEALENKSKPNKKNSHLKILITGSHLSFLKRSNGCQWKENSSPPYCI